MSAPRSSWWPWACALLTVAAITLGMVTEGPGDWLAAALLAVPVFVQVRYLMAASR